MFGKISFGRKAGLGACAVLAAALAGCQNNVADQSRPCPPVKIVQDASFMTRFAGESEDLTDTSFEARITKSDNWCNYLYDDTTTQTQTYLTITFAASRGPKNPDSTAKFNYFVRVTGPGASLVQSNVLDVEVPFTASKVQNAVTDQVDVTIPLKQGENGEFYRIYVGLAVNEKELAYNRRNPQF